MVVPFFPEWAVSPIPSLSQSRLQRYNPMPVEFFPIRPFCPVKPFSKIRDKSSGGMPIPLSLTDKITLLFVFAAEKCRTGFSVQYFTALRIIWFKI